MIKANFFLIKAKMDIMRLSWTSCRNKKKPRFAITIFENAYDVPCVCDEYSDMYTFGSTRNAVKSWNADARRFHCKNRDTG